MQGIIKLGILLCSLSLSAVAYAIAPVEDAYESDATPPVNTSNKTSTVPVSNNSATFSLEQRVTILERQISNLNPLLVQIDDLNQRIQSLQGKIEEQQHQLKLLTEQVRSQYQDVDRRLTQKRTGTVASAAESTSPSGAGPNTAGNITTPVPAVSQPTAAGERAYQAAFQLLKNKQYPLAIEEFESFIKKYPSDINLANANYFLGQLYLLQGQPEQSISRFNYFINTYPQDARVPDALLQLGLAYFAKGDKTTAMDIFKKIIQQYPDSKAAQAAQARLQQFQAMISSANHMETKNKA